MARSQSLGHIRAPKRSDPGRYFLLVYTGMMPFSFAVDGVLFKYSIKGDLNAVVGYTGESTNPDVVIEFSHDFAYMLLRKDMVIMKSPKQIKKMLEGELDPGALAPHSHQHASGGGTEMPFSMSAFGPGNDSRPTPGQYV